MLLVEQGHGVGFGQRVAALAGGGGRVVHAEHAGHRLVLQPLRGFEEPLGEGVELGVEVRVGIGGGHASSSSWPCIG